MTLDNPGDFDVGNPAGFIRSAIAGELNQTEAYDAFHAFGGHLQESTFNTIFKNTVATIGQTPEMLALDPFQVPGPADYGEWATNTPGLYATQVQIQVYDQDLQDWLTLQSTYITSDPHTPSEAEQWAVDTFDPRNTGTNENQVMGGAIAVHLWKTVPLE